MFWKMTTFERKITIVGADNKNVTATLFCEIRFSEDLRKRECIIRLVSDVLDCTSASFDFFGAFCGIREQLAAHALYPLCYGASRNVHPSGMQQDMLEGRFAYKVQMGEALECDVVDIFETGPDVDVSTVSEQKAFWNAWVPKRK